MRLLFLLPLLLWSIPLAAQSEHPFAGTYASSGVTFMLEPSGSGYTGYIRAQGQQVPVEAEANGSALEGHYTHYRTRVPFRAVLEQDQLRVTESGQTYVLQRQTQQTSPATAPAPSPGHSAPAQGDMLGSPDLGVQFQAPEGWIARQGPEGWILGSNTEPGFLMVLTHNHADLASIRAEAQQGIVDQAGTRLFLSGPLEPLGTDGLGGVFEGTIEGQPARAYIVARTAPYGTGLSAMAATTKEGYTDAYRQYAEAIVQSAVFHKPVETNATRSWTQSLSDRRLTYLYSYYSGSSTDGSYVGASEETTMDLCGAGYFWYDAQSSMAVDGGGGYGYNASGYGSDGKRGSGTWKVVQQGGQPTLQLTFHDGTQKAYTISESDGKLHLNGRRYFRTSKNAPVADHRPNC